MSKWVKWLIIGFAIIVGTIFFGSIVLSLAGYMFDFLSMLMDWLAVACRWLAKLVDIFGFTGVFIANAEDSTVMAYQTIKSLWR